MPDPADPPPTRTTPPAADTHAPTESVAVPPDRAAYPFLAPARAADEAGRFGGYRVLGVLGRGGMGVVFRAEDPGLRREVALKVMLPQFAGVPAARGRFLREARSQARVEHDHVAAVHRVGEDGGVPFLVMPLLKGFSLADALRANPRVPVGEAVRIAREIADGLAAAHDTGLIHRDIKPGNVWLEGDRRRVKILDFGLARAVGGADAGADPFDPQTASGALVGTPAYMSPEQANGLAADHRTDLFSLGSVLYQMLAARPPFQAPTLTAMLVAVAHDAPPPPSAFNPAVPPPLDRVVSWLMAKNPADRPPTARAAAEALRHVGEELASVAASAPPAPAPDNAWSGLDPVPLDTPAPAPPRPGRLGLPLLAGGLAALAVFAVGLVLVLRNPDPPPATEPEPPRPARTTSRPTPTPPRATPPADDPPPRNPGASTDPLVKEDFFNVYGMRFRIVPKGTAWLGSRGGAAATREVTIPHDFMLGQFEVTQGEWESVLQRNPSHFSPAGAGAALVRGYAPKERERLPVERVSWDDCQEYIRRVNAQAKEAGWVYRLPTADEWEYACRGGGGRPRADYDFDYYLSRPTRRITLGDARFAPSWGGEKPRVPVPVGSYRGSANRLGLYDMHGNVWEWCHDPGPPDPADPQKVPRRFHRGGGWANDEDVCQAAVSSDCPAADVDNTVGLRLARVPVPGATDPPGGK